MRIPILTFVYDRKGQATKEKPAVVELRISNGSQRKYISTGVKLLPKEWKNGSVVARRDWKELNDMLQIMKSRCSDIIVEMMREGKLDLGAVPGILHDRMMQDKTFLEYAKEMAEVRYKKLSERSIKHYEQFFRYMNDWKGIVYFADVTERNIMKMDEDLTARGLMTATRYCYHKILKVFILMAIDDGLLKKNPYAKLVIKKGDDSGLSKVLTPDEFHRFETCQIDDECLARVRDLFVFQTYTAMGYSDLEDFDYKKCVDINGSKVYTANRNKTNQRFTIVLIPNALAILQRYNYKLPIISNVKYNLYLKAAVKYAKIDKPVTTHYARHTGATLLLNEGNVPMHIVQHILGHSTIRETEKTYAKLLDQTIVESIADYQKRLG